MYLVKNELKCEECGKKNVDCVCFFRGEYDTYICKECLKKALDLITQEEGVKND